MATPREHIGKAQHNESLLNTPRGLEDHPDWRITVAFYAAVHWLRAYLALHGLAAGRRDDLHYDEFSRHLRDLARKGSISAEDVIVEFAELRDLARQSRYYCHPDAWYHQRVFEAEQALKGVRGFVTSNGILP
ncbi:hypothetical protein [Deinococcus sp.]|uniref:hypothetical protein n=1 Tax=Deinococcus sp. TaxID=47478 RepID=UPI003CC5A223